MGMERVQRRALRKELEKRSQTYSEKLTPVPESEWPPPRGDGERPTALWRSREFLVQEYQETDCVRLTVIRVTLGADLHWEDRITWDELQRVKREAGYAEWYGVEVYPRDRDIVYDCKMRHLWLFEKPLPIGWFTVAPR